MQSGAQEISLFRSEEKELFGVGLEHHFLDELLVVVVKCAGAAELKRLVVL